MSFFQSILLGMVQGVTEFLPVSSSGHLVVLRTFLHIETIPPLYDVFLHIATLLAVCIIFRKKIITLFISLFRFITKKNNDADKNNLHLIIAILTASLFTAAVGLGISMLDIEKYPKIVSALFIVTGLILISTRFVKGDRGNKTIGIKEGAITGIAQGLGVFPGISRAGITIAAALGTGMDREKAGEFSLLISIPAILGALLLTFKDSGELTSEITPAVLIAGFISAFIIGVFSLLLLLRLIKKGRLYLLNQIL